MRYIPNALTLLRGFAITPAIAFIIGWYALSYYEYVSDPGMHFPFKSWLLILTLFGLLTDYLDGFLAKTMDWKSKFGARIDPLMDKWFSYVGFATVPLYYGMDWYLIWFILAAIYIDWYSRTTSRMRRQRLILEANPFAQKKTGFLFAAQVAFMTAIAAEDVLSGPVLWTFVFIMFIVAFATMVRGCYYAHYALILYKEEADRRMKERQQQSEPEQAQTSPVTA